MPSFASIHNKKSFFNVREESLGGNVQESEHFLSFNSIITCIEMSVRGFSLGQSVFGWYGHVL
jgi:hypothetical protein